MYESRICFLFTIFVACLQQLCLTLPQVFHPNDYYPNHPYYGYVHSLANSHDSVLSSNATIGHNETSAPVSNNILPPQALPAPLPTQQSPYAPSVRYESQMPVFATPSNNIYHSAPQMPYYASPYSPSLPANPTHQTYTASFPPPDMHGVPHQNHVIHSAHPVYPSPQTHHLSAPFTPQVASPPHHFSSFPSPSPFDPYSNYHNQPTSSYSYPGLSNSGLHAMPSYSVPSFNHHIQPNYANYDTRPAVTTKKATPTTSRPKTTTTTAPKPLEFELSIEDFLYLTQLHQLFNKSLDKQSIDISSLSKLAKRPDDKDESPIFYGGVLDLDELSKIDNMNDLMKAFKKVEPKTQVPRRESVSGASDNPDDGVDDEEAHHQAAGRRRKGSHDAMRSRTPAHNRNKKKRKNKPRKESDRADHGNEDEDNEEVEEEADEDEETEEMVGIGSTPSAAHLGSRPKKQRSGSTTTSTTTVAPVAAYPNPYVYSMPYNYPHLQQQYMQQLQQAMTGHLQSLSRPAEKEIAKFSDEEPLTSPNENRNVINVNIADPHNKVGDNHKYDASLSQETGMKFPLRRGSFNSMANSLAKKAISSILYRIFPTMKHLNVKGVAARGCRDVQSIGSLDSIIMPLGLAVTLHPLLLPLVPFLLLALGSIKAIESATCFVSEYFT